MNFGEYNRRWEKSIRDIDDGLGNLMVGIGSEALTLVRGRVQEIGINAKGLPFTKYSTDPMKAWCGTMTTDACSAAQGKYKRKRPKGSTKPLHSFTLKRGYEEFRELANRRIDITNFSFFNDMWNDIAVISDSSLHDKGFVRIAAKTELQGKILQGNTNRRGPILELSDSEIDTISEDFGTNILTMLRNNGL